jgi:hypothetical protein
MLEDTIAGRESEQNLWILIAIAQSGTKDKNVPKADKALSLASPSALNTTQQIHNLPRLNTSLLKPQSKATSAAEGDARL